MPREALDGQTEKGRSKKKPLYEPCDTGEDPKQEELVRFGGRPVERVNGVCRDRARRGGHEEKKPHAYFHGSMNIRRTWLRPDSPDVKPGEEGRPEAGQNNEELASRNTHDSPPRIKSGPQNT